MMNKISTMYQAAKEYVKSRWGIVSNWRCWWKWASNRLTAIGVLITTFSPDIYNGLLQVMSAYSQLPDSVQVLFNQDMVKYVGLFLIILSIPARITVQKKLPQE